ncbi:MAG: hypothetical protein IJS15_05275 [Victivallales bacterium]|nr:hypothetical protein [Victivallales bacterium]
MNHNWNNNIGDEAIIASVVDMLKGIIPDVELTVATADAATAGLLGVSVAPSFGFAGDELGGFAEEVATRCVYMVRSYRAF